MHWQDYKIMKSIDEALEALVKYQGKARVVAGGTDLIVQFQQGDLGRDVTLLDIGSIPEMQGVKENDGWIYVGAATTMSELAQSAILERNGKTLAMGARSLGSPQIRNVATVGGNVVNAQPAADTSIPLVALGAEAKIVTSQGERWMLVEDLFLGIGRSSVDPSKELVTHFRFPPTGKRGRSSFHRIARRKAFTLPTLVVAALVELDDKMRSFAKVRLTAGPVARTPWRARKAEEILLGSSLTTSVIDKAAELAKEEAQPRDSIRGGSEYRKEMVEVLLKRAIKDCLEPFGGVVDA